MAMIMPMECIQVSGVNAQYAGKTMKAKRLRKLLKKVPKGYYVKVHTYGYSQGQPYRYDPDPELTIDSKNRHAIITIDE